MIALTKYEAMWMVDGLDKLSHLYRKWESDKNMLNIEKRILRIRAEQLDGIVERLSAAIKDGDRRIEIKY